MLTLRFLKMVLNYRYHVAYEMITMTTNIFVKNIRSTIQIKNELYEGYMFPFGHMYDKHPLQVSGSSQECIIINIHQPLIWFL